MRMAENWGLTPESVSEHSRGLLVVLYANVSRIPVVGGLWQDSCRRW